MRFEFAQLIVPYPGDVTMAGSINMGNGNINWGNNTPNKQRYAASAAGPWHDSMQSGDVYCCDWNYTTNVWGAPYKKVGSDGKNGQNGMDGSDANVNFENVKKIMEKYYGINTTLIDPGSIYSPFIYGANLIGATITTTGTGNDLVFSKNDKEQAQIWLDGANLMLGGSANVIIDTLLGNLFVKQGSFTKRVLVEGDTVVATFG